MTRTVQTSIASLIALVALGVPALAAAKPKSQSVAEPLFAVTLKGTQVSTWEHKHDPQAACDATIRGNGSQEISYDLIDPIKLKLVVPKKGRATLVLPKDTLAQYGIPAFAIPFRVRADREGSQETIDAPGGACNGTGGWDGIRPQNDCDELRWGRLDLQLGYAGYAGAAAPPAGRFQIAGKYHDFIDTIVPQVRPTYAGEGEALSASYDYCPYWADGSASPESDELVPAMTRLPVGKLRGLAKGKTLKASAHKRAVYAEGGFKGDTLHTWNIKLKRIR